MHTHNMAVQSSRAQSAEQQRAERQREAVQTMQQWGRHSSSKQRSISDGATRMTSDARQKTFPLTTPTTLAVNNARRV